MRLASISDIAAAVRGRRADLGLSQGGLAERAGVSRRWVNQFENGGRATAEVGAVLRVLDALGLDVHAEAATADHAEPRPGPDVVDLDALLDGLRDG